MLFPKVAKNQRFVSVKFTYLSQRFSYQTKIFSRCSLYSSILQTFEYHSQYRSSYFDFLNLIVQYADRSYPDPWHKCPPISGHISQRNLSGNYPDFETPSLFWVGGVTLTPSIVHDPINPNIYSQTPGTLSECLDLALWHPDFSISG